MGIYKILFDFVNNTCLLTVFHDLCFLIYLVSHYREISILDTNATNQKTPAAYITASHNKIYSALSFTEQLLPATPG